MDERKSPSRRLAGIGAVGVVAIVVIAATFWDFFGDCTTVAVPGAGMAVPAGATTMPKRGPVPAGSNCTPAVGDTCGKPGQHCALFGTCTDTWADPAQGGNGACTCKCL